MSPTIVIYGRPVPKERPRFYPGRRRPATPKRSEAYEGTVAWECRAARVRLGDVPVEVTIELHSVTRLQGDVDNYAKAILDGLQKGEAIADDRQVVGLSVHRIRALENKVVVHLRPHPWSAA